MVSNFYVQVYTMKLLGALGEKRLGSRHLLQNCNSTLYGALMSLFVSCFRKYSLTKGVVQAMISSTIFSTVNLSG